MADTNFAGAINEALSVAMEIDPNVICYGLGVTDPKGIFGTTLGLESKFGSARVFDMPLSENAMTGIGVGATAQSASAVRNGLLTFAFIGSNTQLVAPVTVGENATIGAGSTITKDTPARQLTLSRAKQVSVINWQRPIKKEKL